MKYLYGIIVLIEIGAAVVSLLPILMSPMMFDAPGSTKDPATWTLLGLLVSFPVSVGLGIWASQMQDGWSDTFLCLALPLLPIIAVLVLVAAKM